MERRSSKSVNPKDFVKKCIAYSFLKMPQVVLQNRTLAISSDAEHKKSDWFNLRIPEVEWITEQVVGWKKDQKRPLNIFVYWSPGEESQERYLLEHWQCRCTQHNNALLQGAEVRSLYNKFVMMFRSLYMYAKVLPAFSAFKAQLPTSSAKLIHQISPTALTAAFPFGTVKPEKAEIGKLETPFGTIEMTVQYRKDVSFAISAERPEVIPAEAIIPDYAPSLSNKIPIRTKPVSIQTTALQRNSTSNVQRQRSNTAAAAPGHATSRVGGYSQPTLTEHHNALSFSPPVTGAQSMWTANQPGPRMGPPQQVGGASAGTGRQRQESEPPFPTFNYTPGSVGAYSTSPRFPIGYSSSPRSELDDLISPRRSRSSTMGLGEGERILTAVSPPSFSMYERAMHESPDAEFDGPVFSIEGFDDDEEDVNSFVRFCQSKPTLMLVEEEQRAASGGKPVVRDSKVSIKAL